MGYTYSYHLYFPAERTAALLRAVQVLVPSEARKASYPLLIPGGDTFVLQAPTHAGGVVAPPDPAAPCSAAAHGLPIGDIDYVGDFSITIPLPLPPEEVREWEGEGWEPDRARTAYVDVSLRPCSRYVRLSIDGHNKSSAAQVEASPSLRAKLLETFERHGGLLAVEEDASGFASPLGASPPWSRGDWRRVAWPAGAREAVDEEYEQLASALRDA